MMLLALILTVVLLALVLYAAWEVRQQSKPFPIDWKSGTTEGGRHDSSRSL